MPARQTGEAVMPQLLQRTAQRTGAPSTKMTCRQPGGAPARGLCAQGWQRTSAGVARGVQRPPRGDRLAGRTRLAGGRCRCRVCQDRARRRAERIHLRDRRALAVQARGATLARDHQRACRLGQKKRECCELERACRGRQHGRLFARCYRKSVARRSGCVGWRRGWRAVTPACTAAGPQSL